jgi:hypothetical protein
MFADYADIEIDIQPRVGDVFPFAVRAPGGEARGELRLPSTDPAYQKLAARLATLDTTEAVLSQLGRMLFGALFQDKVKEIYARSQGKLKDGQGLRIKLIIAATEREVAELPWEYLNDPDPVGPLVLLDTPVVRYLPLPSPRPTLKTQLPLRVLLTGAQARRGDVERELSEIQEALAHLGEHVKITLDPHLSFQKLQRWLRKGFDIWHFVGSGGLSEDGKTAQIFFENEDGSTAINAPELATLLYSSNMRLAVLDTRESAYLATDPLRNLAPALVRAGVPAVIAMQLSAPAEATRSFAKNFYQTLAEGFPIDACVTEGRKAVMGVVGLGRPDWGVPVIYTRAPDGKLFDLPEPPVATIPGLINQLPDHDRVGAEVRVNDRTGTLLSVARPLTVQRLGSVPQPPRAPHIFLDREDIRRDLLPELRPRRGAWLHGAPGCGLSALLRQLANTPAATALPDGVVYLDGEFESDNLDNIVQNLFNRFYTSGEPIKAHTDQTYLGNLKAMFILDRLQLAPANLKRLVADVLCDGAIIAGAESPAPDLLRNIRLPGIPLPEAVALFSDEAQIGDTTPEMTSQLEQLCAALECLPLPLLLAARLVRNQIVSPQKLVDVLEDAIQRHTPLAERAVGQVEDIDTQPIRPPARRQAPEDALTRAVRMVLMAVSDQDQAVLAALVRIGGFDATIDALIAGSQHFTRADVEIALGWLAELRLVEGQQGRYSIPSGSLRRVLDRLLKPGEERQHAAAFFAAGAMANAGNLAWLEAERSNLMAAIETLLAQGQAAQAGALAQAIQPLLVLRGLWGSWSQVIDWALQAAQTTGDQALLAWALHERGTHAGLMAERATAAADLQQARDIRRRIGDRAGAAATLHNIAYLELLPPVAPAQPWWRRTPRRAIIIGAAVVALLSAGVAGTAALRSYPPNTGADSGTTVEDRPITLNVLSNDRAQRGQLVPGSLSIKSGPDHGAATIDVATNQIVYTPGQDFFGADRLVYQVCDDHPECAQATVDLTIASVNDLPVATDKAMTTEEDTSVSIDVLSGDGDVEDQQVALATISPASKQGGSVTIEDNRAAYQPPPNFFGTDAFTYTIADKDGGRATATVTVTVTPVNDPPVIASEPATTDEDTGITIPIAKLLGAASDVDHDELTLTRVGDTSAQSGTVALDAESVAYTPALNFNGTDSFSYTIGDGHGGSATASVTVTVRAFNDAPVASSDTAETQEDTPLTIPADRLLAKATDVDHDTLKLIAASPSNVKQGNVSLAGDTVTYTPAQNFSGEDRFTYTVDDGHGASATAPVTITVQAVNDPPIAAKDSPKTDEDTPVTIDVLSNDYDVDDKLNPASIRITKTTTHGTARVDQRTGLITYAPAPNYSGADGFTYRICDPSGACDPADVSIAIAAVNDRPTAANDTATTLEDKPIGISVLANDGDIDGRLSFASVRVIGNPRSGKTVVNQSNGRIGYTPNPNYFGDDQFTYQVCDDGGACASATVSVNITPVNDPPIAKDDSVSTPQETPIGISVLANDRDIDGQLVLASVRVTGAPAHGLTAVNPKNGKIGYTPEIYFSGTDRFTYQVCDDGGACASAVVTVNVLERTPPPIPAIISPTSGSIFPCSKATSIELSWSPSNDPSGIARYDWVVEVFKYTSSTSTPTGSYVAFTSGSTANTSITTSIGCNNMYRWRVRAVDRAGNIGNYSPFADFQMQYVTPSAAGSDLGQSLPSSAASRPRISAILVSSPTGANGRLGVE